MAGEFDITTWMFIATAVAGITAGVLGWVWRQGEQPGTNNRATIGGAAIIDTSSIYNLIEAVQQLRESIKKRSESDAAAVKALERQATAMEGLLELHEHRDKREAQHRHDSELEKLRRELDALKRER